MSDRSSQDEAQAGAITLRRLSWLFFYIGLTGYGGGPAIIGYMKQVFVDRWRLVKEQDFSTGLSLSQMLPGANALASAEFLGYTMRGSWGAVLSSAMFILPSLVLMTVLSAVYFAVGHVAVTEALFTGLRAVVVALLVNAVVALGRTAIKDVAAALIAALTLVVMLVLSAPPVAAALPVPPVLLVIPIAAGLGWLIYGRQPAGPVEAYSRPRHVTSRSFWIGWGLVALVTVALMLLCWQTVAVQLVVAMFRVGALTFGGGYAAVPLFQAEATHFGITPQQFVDGLALGQITPGPVLVTATFIGYKVLGVWGAILGTVAVFLPGALAMFFVAHQHERVRHLAWLQAMVRGVVAAFIGVLLQVSISIAAQALHDWRTVLMAVAGIVVLVVWRKDALWVILGGAAVSLLLFGRG